MQNILDPVEAPQKAESFLFDQNGSYIAGFCDGSSFENAKSAGVDARGMREFASAIAARNYNDGHENGSIRAIAFGLVEMELTVVVVLDDIDVDATRVFFRKKNDIELASGAQFSLIVKAAQGRPIADLVPQSFVISA
jgi:translation elongation factor EF-1beta